MQSTNRWRAARLVALLAASAAIVGCGKESKANQSAAKAVEAKPDVGGVNAAVPAALESALTFEAVTIDEGTLSAIVPVGWEGSKYIPGRYRPKSGSTLGFMTSFKVGSNCDGECTPKDYKPIAMKVEFKAFDNGSKYKISKDEKLANGRLVVASSGKTTKVVAAWWKSGARQYIYCRATLADKAATAVAAFEQACRATRHNNW